MEIVIAAVGGWLVYREWKAGRITLPLMGYGHLVGQLATFVADREIVPRSIITDSHRARGAISQFDLQDYVLAQLSEQRFPRKRLHDLRAAVCAELKRRGHSRNLSDLKQAFDSIAEVSDDRAKQWAS